MKKVGLVIVAGVVLVSFMVAGVAWAAEKGEKIPVRLGATSYATGNMRSEGPEFMAERMEEFWKDPRGTGAVENTLVYLWDLMFMYANPDIQLERIPFNLWAVEDQQQALMASIVDGTAPSVLAVGRDQVYYWAKEGILADITDYVSDVEKWPKTNALSEEARQHGIINGRVYAIPGAFQGNLGVAYRKDYFKEAGIFNEKGEAGPPVNWTADDLIDVCQKLANPKKNRYALTVTENILRRDAFGDFGVKPDPTGKYTWVADFDTPGKRHFEYLQKLVKTGSVLYTIEERPKMWANFSSGRTAMSDWEPVAYLIWEKMSAGHGSGSFPPGVDVIEDLSGTIFPAGPEGIVPNSVTINLVGVLGTLPKDELEATLEWIRFREEDPNLQRQMQIIAYWFTNELRKTDPTVAPMYGTWVIQRPPVFEYENDLVKVSGLPLSMSEWPEVEDIIALSERIRALPIRPASAPYGAPVPQSSIDVRLNPVYELIYSDPDANWEKELARAETLVNSTVLNYKDEDVTKENMKDYYTALEEFYQKNYPDYFNKYFVKLLEERYKVW